MTPKDPNAKRYQDWRKRDPGNRVVYLTAAQAAVWDELAAGALAAGLVTYRQRRGQVEKVPDVLQYALSLHRQRQQ